MGKLTMSMAIFNSDVANYRKVIQCRIGILYISYISSVIIVIYQFSIIYIYIYVYMYHIVDGQVLRFKRTPPCFYGDLLGQIPQRLILGRWKQGETRHALQRFNWSRLYEHLEMTTIDMTRIEKFESRYTLNIIKVDSLGHDNGYWPLSKSSKYWGVMIFASLWLSRFLRKNTCFMHI